MIKEIVNFNRFAEIIDDTVTKCKSRKVEKMLPVVTTVRLTPQTGHHPHFEMMETGGYKSYLTYRNCRTIVLVNYESDRVNEIVSGLAKTLTKTHSLWIVSNLQGLTPTVDGDIFISIGGPNDKPNESLGVSVTEFVDGRGHVFWLAGVIKGNGEVDLITNRTADHPNAKPEVKFTQTKETTDDFIESKLRSLQRDVAKVGANLHIFMNVNGYDRIINLSKSAGVETVSSDSFDALVSSAKAFIDIVEKNGYEIDLRLSAMVDDEAVPNRNMRHSFTHG